MGGDSLSEMSREQRLANPQAVRAVFFDAGYTLLAPHPSVVEIALGACARRGVILQPEHLLAQLPAAETTLREAWRANPWLWSDERDIQAIWTRYLRVLLAPALAHLPEEQRTACVSEVTRDFDGAANYALYPDVVPVLEALRARELTLGVISDWGLGLGLILRHHDLVQYFDFAVISAAVRLAKPDPALFETALRRANAIGDYAVHIGDSYVLDVLGARAAGIAPILLDRARKYGATTLDCPIATDLYGVLDLLGIPQPRPTA